MQVHVVSWGYAGKDGFSWFFDRDLAEICSNHRSAELHQDGKGGFVEQFIHDTELADVEDITEEIRARLEKDEAGVLAWARRTASEDTNNQEKNHAPCYH